MNIETYNALVGTRRWAHISPYQFGAITCKADVLVAAKLLMLTKAVAEHIAVSKTKRK